MAALSRVSAVFSSPPACIVCPGWWFWPWSHAFGPPQGNPRLSISSKAAGQQRSRPLRGTAGDTEARAASSWGFGRPWCEERGTWGVGDRVKGSGWGCDGPGGAKPCLAPSPPASGSQVAPSATGAGPRWLTWSSDMHMGEDTEESCCRAPRPLFPSIQPAKNRND